MLRLLKKSGWALLVAVAAQTATAFTILGPREPYQIDAMGYIGDYSFQPKNLGEEYRWNVPIIYYVCDFSFLDYFGSNGVQAVDSAASLINAVMRTNVSSYSTDLSEFPDDSQRMNYEASALHMFDLRSCVVECLLERLGLGDPERFSWTLRNRVGAPSCPFFLYTVIKRNFDPVTLAPSSYVNGNLYSYQIVEGCPAVDRAVAIPFLVDPDATYQSAVATPKIMFADSLSYGMFYTGLTRDDVGGLRYLYEASNVNLESAGTNTATFVTNTVPQLEFTSNLTLFAAQALTNPPAALQALYPNLVITASSNFFVNTWVTNLTPILVNDPHAPLGSPPTLSFITNRTLVIQNYFQHFYGNLEIVVFTNGVWKTFPVVDIFPLQKPATVTLQTIAATNNPWTPFGTALLVTNVYNRNFVTNEIVGEFVILPTNFCDIAIIANQATFTNAYTNLLFTITNTITITNAVTGGTTNIDQFYSQSLVDYSTNHAFVALPVSCPGSNPGLLGGIEKLQFVRRDYDSLLGRFWYPITNSYKVLSVTNYQATLQTVTRIVTAPDIVFSAGDIVSDPTASPLVIPTVQRQVPNWNSLNTGAGLFGPGTIESPVSFVLDKVGPIFLNLGPFFMDEVSSDLQFVWGTFDGTTNSPIVYPSGTSLANLANQVLFSISALDLISGTPLGQATSFSASAGLPFRVQLQAAGGQPPYSWSLSPSSPGLPPNFTGPDANGTISGNPNSAGVGTYDFSIRLKDSSGRSMDVACTITINP